MPSKYCLSIPLEVGALIIGYILSILKIIMLFTTWILVIIAHITSQEHPEMITSEIKFANGARLFMGFLQCMQILLSINLLSGLYKNKRKPVTKFYMLYSILLILEIIIIMLPIGIFRRKFGNMALFTLTLEVILILFEMFSIFIVRRCSKKMKEQAARDRGIMMYSALQCHI